MVAGGRVALGDVRSGAWNPLPHVNANVNSALAIVLIVPMADTAPAACFASANRGAALLKIIKPIDAADEDEIDERKSIGLLDGCPLNMPGEPIAELVPGKSVLLSTRIKMS